MDRQIEKILVEVRGVNKTYHHFRDLKNISFSFSVGRSYAIVGPRHSGTTGLLRLIYCTSHSDKGEIFVLGYNAKIQPREIKSVIGVVPETLGLEEDLTVFEQLRVFAKFYDLAGPVIHNRIRELLQQMELAGLENYTIKYLSLFQRKKLSLARALINQPQLLIIDEPTKGLGGRDKRWFLETLSALKKSNLNLLIGTSDSSEAEALCDYVLLLHKGRLVRQGSPSDLKLELIGSRVLEFQCQPQDVEYHVSKFSQEYEVFIVENRLRIFLKEGQEPKDLLTKVSSDNIITRKPNIDDLFVKLVGHPLEPRSWLNH